MTLMSIMVGPCCCHCTRHTCDVIALPHTAQHMRCQPAVRQTRHDRSSAASHIQHTVANHLFSDARNLSLSIEPGYMQATAATICSLRTPQSCSSAAIRTGSSP